MKKNQTWKYFVYTFLSTIALVCIFHNQIGYMLTDATVKYADKTVGKGLVPEYDADNVQPYSAAAAAEATFKAKDVRARGQISIPSVGMSLPVYPGLNDVHLYLGAAEHNPRSEVTPEENGNYILASHFINHRGSLFEPLTRVQKGAKIYVAFNEKVYEYEAEGLHQIAIDDDSWLQPTEDKKLITLYTCVSLYAPDLRWVVRGHQTAEYDLNESLPQHILNSFAKDSSLRGTYLASYEWLRPA